MVNLPANSNSALPEWVCDDPIKRSLWKNVTGLGAVGMADLEANIDRQLSEAIASVETLRPGYLASALVDWVDSNVSNVRKIPPAITGGKDLLREHVEARGTGRYWEVWPEMRDHVLVQATLCFARMGAGWRIAPIPSEPSGRSMRLMEKLWFVFRILDRAELEPTEYFDRSVWDRRPGFRG